MIPKQLQNEEINFVLLEKKGKKPFQQGWQNKTIKYFDEELNAHLVSKGNYGVLGGGERNLIIIDFDNKELQNKLIKKLPKTFMVQTGGGLFHLYYFSNNSKSFKIFDEDLNTLADVQGKGKQVVGANSTHPNGKKYKIIQDAPIAFLDYSELQAQLMPYDKKPKKEVKKKEVIPKTEFESDFIDECKSQISISDVLSLMGIDTSKNPTECPFHSSKGGKCLGFQNDIAHCFHCDESWNIFSLVKQWKNTDFKGALEILADTFGLQDQLKQAKEDYLKKQKGEEPKENEKQKLSDEESHIILKQTYEQIIQVLKLYVKLKKEYYDLIAVWIIGTYCMKKFETYPYLFINAQKGSGKTRLLKLIESLTHNGELLASMREAVLFRIATTERTILIDELEGLDRKENAPLKELLNACYKRGTKVYRMRKVKDEYVAEAFYPFTPIAIANISGMDDVLSDRCITIRLDKSIQSSFALLLEDFNDSPLVKNIRANFEQILVYVCSVCMAEYTVKGWNRYINIKYNNNTYNTYNTPYTQSQEENTQNSSVVTEFSVYTKIHDSGIRGRHLELVFPLLNVALMIDYELFERILTTAKNMTKEKKEEDIMESVDVSLIEFVSKMISELEYGKYRFVHEITEQFRYFLGIRKEREREEINPQWVGRALRRLGLVLDKRRLSAGVEVRLNVIKAGKLLEDIK